MRQQCGHVTLQLAEDKGFNTKASLKSFRNESISITHACIQQTAHVMHWINSFRRRRFSISVGNVRSCLHIISTAAYALYWRTWNGPLRKGFCIASCSLLLFCIPGSRMVWFTHARTHVRTHKRLIKRRSRPAVHLYLLHQTIRLLSQLDIISFLADETRTRFDYPLDPTINRSSKADARSAFVRHKLPSDISIRSGPSAAAVQERRGRERVHKRCHDSPPMQSDAKCGNATVLSELIYKPNNVLNCRSPLYRLRRVPR